MILVGCAAPLVERAFFHAPGPALQRLLNELYDLSETPFYALGYGLALFRTRFEDERGLLLFHIPLAILWAVGPLIPGSLPYHLGLAFRGLEVPPGATCFVGPETNGMPIWIFPRCLGDIWFWADQVTDYPLAYTIIYGLLKSRFR